MRCMPARRALAASGPRLQLLAQLQELIWSPFGCEYALLLCAPETLGFRPSWRCKLPCCHRDRLGRPSAAMVMPMSGRERLPQTPDSGEPSCSGRDDAAAAQRAEDLHRALQRVQSGAVRGALIGVPLRGRQHLAGHALGAAGGAGGRRQRRAVSGVAAVKDTLRYTAFIGALAATYIGVEEGISRVFGKERCAGVGLGASGAADVMLWCLLAMRCQAELDRGRGSTLVNDGPACGAMQAAMRPAALHEQCHAFDCAPVPVLRACPHT